MVDVKGKVRKAVRWLVRGDSTSSDAAISAIRVSGFFDEGWYLRSYPDVAQAGLDAFEHYLRHGRMEGRQPGPYFDAAYYLEKNPDLQAAGIDPLSHFCTRGWRESRLPTSGFNIHEYAKIRHGGAVLPTSLSQFASGVRELAPHSVNSMAGGDREVIEQSGIFDGAYYLERYPEVRSSGLDPIDHYLKNGAGEKKDPSPWFNTSYYFANNPDVAKAKVNPLRHFCEVGGMELRNPSPAFDSGWYWLWHMLPDGLDGNPLARYLEAGEAAPKLPTMMPEGGLSLLERQALLKQAGELVDSGQLSAADLRKTAQLATRIGGLQVAEKALARLITADWNNAANHMELATVLVSQKKWWLAVESYKSAIAIEGGHPNWSFLLGRAQEAMNRFDEAVTAYQHAVDAFPERAEWQYYLGRALQKAGKEAAARQAYATYRSFCNQDAVKRHGEGVTHQAHGLWKDAQKAYAVQILRNPLDSQLRYRLGMAHDRLYEWDKAAEQYRNAIAIALNAGDLQAGWHYRLGFVNERLQQWEQAATSYSSAILLSEKHIPYWNFRLGYVLEQAYKYEAACAAYLNVRTQQELVPNKGVQALSRIASEEGVDLYFIPGIEREALIKHLASFSKIGVLSESLAQNTSVPLPHYQLGEALERAGRFEDAVMAYRAALDRSSEFRPLWFYRLGYVLYRTGRLKEACEALRQARQLQRPHGQSEDVLKTNEALCTTTCYVEYAEVLPVREEVILYESFNGNSLTCNPLALFRELLKHPRYGSYLHVWVLNDISRIPEQYRRLPNVAFVSRGSDGYLRHLATAKYLINNSGFPPYFVRRPEQKYLATWHGTPLKTLGKEQKYKFYDHKRTQRNFLQATHILSPNKHTSDIQLDSYDIRPLYTGLFAETGYPRIDLTLNASEADKERMRARMNLSADRPVVLYAPTWRGTLDDVAFDTTRLESDLEKLAELDCQVIFRGHSLLERVLSTDDIACQVVPADIDTNELLSIVDVLITDYSSIFFDFLATGRPVLYYIYDVEEYEEERGLYFDMEEMPGIKARTIEELCDGVALAIRGEGIDAGHYRQSQALYNYRDDGSASQRAIEFLFEDSRSHTLDYCIEQKPSIILHGGSFTPNGITSSFINLVNALDRRKYNIIVAFAPDTISLAEENVLQFRKLPGDIYAVPRYGNIPMTLEERWLRRHQENGTIRLGPEAQGVLMQMYSREFQRMFGDKNYQAAISFSGYDAFWSSILNFNRLGHRKSIYLHNDIYSEYVKRFPELDRMFQLYGHSDALISVSNGTNALNIKNLAERLGTDASKFVSCENVINGEEIIASAQLDFEVAEDAALFEGAGPVFINIGRLSVEKDQEKLIRAFSVIAREYGDAKLLVLGGGPLDAHLAQVVSALEMQGKVHLLGYRRNPYPYLRAADCFVMSSNHEGQPMTLLESLVLGKPIIATDIVGNRSVLGQRWGLLVENSLDGLVGGMRDFIAGSVDTSELDWRGYNMGAVEQFHRHAIGIIQ